MASFGIGTNYTDPVKYEIEPVPAQAPPLGSGAWTFDLLITDDNTHKGALRQHPSLD